MIYRGVVAERDSADLFTLDTVGDSATAKKFPKHTAKKLKSDEILAARSAIAPVDSRKRAGDKTTDGILAPKRQRTGYVTQKELARLKKVADGHHEDDIEFSETVFDPWAVAPEPEEKSELHDTRFDPRKAPKSLTEKPISLAASGKRIPAVAKPTGGFSYNPAFPEYEARLAEESEKAIEAERKRLAEEEADRIRMEASARSAAEADAAEARAELSEWEEDSEWEGVASGGEELKVSAKRPGRKNQVQRNRIKRRKEEERRLKHEQKTKVRKAQLEQIKEIAKMASEKDLARALAKKADESDDDDTMDGTDDALRRKRLGKMNLPEKDLELVLPDELQDSLRLLRPEGNLLKDRYRSLLVRGKLESRRRTVKKQARMKSTEKWTYKDFRI